MSGRGKAGPKGQPAPGPLRIKKISWLDRQRLYPRAQVLSQELSGWLDAWNLEMKSPERILEALGLTGADLNLLHRLAGLAEGWHAFRFEPGAAAEAGRLAALGLIGLTRFRRRLSLTGAGRQLLLLTTIDPQIKKARPADGLETAWPERRKDGA